MPQNRPPKTGFGDRQVGAFCKKRAGHTETPFIFWPFLLFFQKFDRFRGWCNITPGSVLFLPLLLSPLLVAYSSHRQLLLFYSQPSIPSLTHLHYYLFYLIYLFTLLIWYWIKNKKELGPVQWLMGDTTLLF